MTHALLATCADVPDLDEDGRCLARALAARGADVRPAVWTDESVDWAAADLVLIRSTWDYARQRDRFLSWATQVSDQAALHNPVPLLAWTTDKTYLRDLAQAGVPVVDTEFLDTVAEHRFAGVEHVVKPAVSAGSLDTTRLAADDPRSSECVRAIVESGRTAMVQPYLDGVDHAGETALLYLDGVFSHALRKGPILAASQGEVDGLFAQEDMSPREPSPEELAVGEAAVAAVPGGAPLYARVDLLPSADGPVLLELELAEPSFFLEVAPDSATLADRWAAAVLARA